jgi:hypothetical protein
MTSMTYGREYLHVVWVHEGGGGGGRNAWVKKNQVFLIFLFFFLGILRDERFNFVKSSII